MLNRKYNHIDVPPQRIGPGALITFWGMLYLVFPWLAMKGYSALLQLKERLGNLDESTINQNRSLLVDSIVAIRKCFIGLADGRFDYLFEGVGEMLATDPIRLDTVREWANKLDNVMEHELKHTMCFITNPGMESHFYLDTVPEVIRDQAPQFTDDLLEANKCLLFARNTACVFHCMRALELTLPIIAKYFREAGSKYDEKKTINGNWGTILSALDKEIRRLGAAENTKKKTTILRKVSTMSARMWSYKDAWRNDVMHAKGPFTEEVATEILNYTTNFVKYIAEDILAKKAKSA